MLMKTDILNLRAAKQFAREPYAWPGAYPKALTTADGGCLCSECVRREWALVCAESFENTNCGFRVAGVGVNWENTDLYCDHCNVKIESAYGEYKKVQGAALDEYKKVQGAALDEYKKVDGAALDEYLKVKGAAFATAWWNDKV
jgi:hypothetical protein